MSGTIIGTLGKGAGAVPASTNGPHMGLSDWLRPLVNFASQHGRRVHVVNGRAHLELRALSPRQYELFVERLREALAFLEGAEWVEANPSLGRVIVALDERVCPVGAVTRLLDRVETELGLETLPFPADRPEHPGDLEPIVRCIIELGGDLAGMGMAIAGRIARLPTLPLEIDALAVLALFDAPRLRAAVEDRLGRQTTSFVLTIANAMAQGLAQSPLGPVVDVAYHGLVLAERVIRRNTWAERERELCGQCADAIRHVLVPPPRPVPLPPGPVESYADAALIASGGAFAIGVAMTGSLASATPPLLSGLPKPARLGREAFASYLAFALARRGAIPLDRRALRRLDRVTCLVVPVDLLLAVDVLPGSVIAAGGPDAGAIRARVRAMLDPCRPWETREDTIWTLAPLDALQARTTTGYRRLALRRGDTIVAIVRAQVILDPEADALLAAARRADLRIVVAAPSPLDVAGLAADEFVPNGEALPDEIRRLQREGQVVCLLAARETPALAVADCGIGLTRDAQAVPWTAHVLCTDRLDDARFLVEACRTARDASRQSVQLAGVGAGLGLVLSLGGLSPDTATRVSTAVNLTSLLAIANGARLGVALALRPAPARHDPTPWHALDVPVVLERLRTSFEGLASSQAAQRLVVGDGAPGPLARLTEAVVEQLRNPLTPLLAVGAGLSAFAGSVADASMVTGVVVLNACIGAVQRLRTDRAIDGLADRTPQRVRVRRDGIEQPLDAAELVAGDVVVLQAGDAIPADCRIIAEHNVEVDESALTGESLPVPKSARASRATIVAERSSMLYDGTSVVAGTATAVVVAVGDATETRRAARAARGRKPREGVEARLESLTGLMVPAAVLSGLGIATVGLLRGRPGREVLGTGTSLAVAAVPEGLPLLAMAAQLAAARRLSLRGTLVRNPRTIEALGRVNVVCFDKTGTVTEGRLRLRAVWEGEHEYRPGHDACQLVTLAAALRATPDAVDGEKLPHLTDQALVDGARSCGVTVQHAAPGWVRLAELPFEPGRGYHAVLGRTGEHLLLSVKGAPEILLDRCAAWRDSSSAVVTLDVAGRSRLAEHASRMASEGLRVLAVAERTLELDAAFDSQSVRDLLFLGFVALSDPVRPTAREALQGLRQAGVDALLMTGDHPGTAARIAAELELDHGLVLTGPELDEMDDDAIEASLRTVRVFARMTPVHKVRLVSALQRSGKIVAMTGDGANDAAAIRLANVGIALGRRGAPAAREAADLVVTDDRIETIVDAVLEGRAMWVSVRDAVAVLVGGNLGELAFSLISGIAAQPVLNARQLLLVNLLTDVAPAMAIALRPPPDTTAEALLHEGPEASLGERLVSDILWRAAVTGSAAAGAWLAARPRANPAQAGTVALVALVGAQLGQTLATGGRSPMVVATSAGSLVALGTIVQTPGLSQLFGCTPLGPIGWATGLGAAGLATAASVVLPRMWPEVQPWLDARFRQLTEGWQGATTLGTFRPIAEYFVALSPPPGGPDGQRPTT